MNLKNHTTARPWQLTGDRGDTPTYAPGQTFKFNLKDIPPLTRRMCNYVAGILITLDSVVFKYEENEEGTDNLGVNVDHSDVAYGLFESAEVQQSMFGTPVSSNHYLARYFGLFEFVGNGMQRPSPSTPYIASSTGNNTYSGSWYIPLSALNGMKGHHTCQPACCYDRAQFILRTAGTGAHGGFTWVSGGTLSVSAIIVAEPEVRLGPGTQFVLYRQTAAPSSTVVTLDALGNSSTLEGVEQGAGLAFMAWMSDLRAYGGAGSCGDMEYLNVPWRDIQQTRHLEPFYADYCGVAARGEYNGLYYANPSTRMGDLYPPHAQVTHAPQQLAWDAHFLPIITPHAFLETSKLQVMQGSATLNLKNVSGFRGEHIVAVQQYHSWTPAKIEDVLRKLVDSGVMQGVWGTNDVIPSVKIANKQPAGSINPSKTRFFALTWVPKETVVSPPKQ